MQNRIFSVDNPKAIKAQGLGWLNAIHYMAPHTLGSTKRHKFNLCGNASPGCIKLCLGEHSGNAMLYSTVRNSRRVKARRFMYERPDYMRDMVRSIELLIGQSRRIGMKLCVRLNGSTDIAWESVGCERNGIKYRNLFEMFPDITFVDYTKNARRFARPLPANYYLTFSRSETNDHDSLLLLSQGFNVAVVFAGTKPDTWHGFPVIDGDQHDLRHLDPRGGYVIGLSPKGNRAKRDRGGFVIRNAA